MESTPSTPFDRRPPFMPMSFQPMSMQPISIQPMSPTPPSVFNHRQPVHSMPMVPRLQQFPPNTSMPRMPEYNMGPFGLNRSMEEINKQLDWFVDYMYSTARLRPNVPSATATLGQPTPFSPASQSGSSNLAPGLPGLPGSSMPFSSENSAEENKVELLIKGWIAKKLQETDLAPLPLKKGNHEGLNLTQLEESTVRCLYNVFNWLNQPPSLAGLNSAEFSPLKFNQFCCEKLMAACMYLPGHSKLSFTDRYMLANYGWANALSVKNHLLKLARVNTWQNGNQKHDSSNPASDHSTFYDLCANPTVFCILVAIMIYNPDLVNLQAIEFIRFEQYSYIYLLKRFLEDTLGNAERAKLEHYKLIYTIEKIMIIRQQTMYIEQFRRIQD